MDDNGNEVLSLGSMVKVSEDTIRIILCRDSLEADEFVKFQVSAVQTCRRCVTRPRLSTLHIHSGGSDSEKTVAKKPAKFSQSE